MYSNEAFIRGRRNTQENISARYLRLSPSDAMEAARKFAGEVAGWAASLTQKEVDRIARYQGRTTRSSLVRWAEWIAADVASWERKPAGVRRRIGEHLYTVVDTYRFYRAIGWGLAMRGAE